MELCPESAATSHGPPAWVMAAPWLLCGLISTSQVYFLWPVRVPEPSFLRDLAWQYPPWLYLAAAAPLVARMARRFPLGRDSWTRHLAPHLLANATLASGYALVVCVAGVLFGDAYYQETPFLFAYGKLLAKGVQLQLFVYWLVVGFVHAYDYHRKARDAELAFCRLETQLAHAQLEALKMQLHPHFLFNTLHAIGVLVRKQDTQGSLQMLSGLADLLRLALDNTGRQMVPLKQELDFLGRYLAIEKVRFCDRLDVRIDVAPEVLDALVPNLILQPLVENAIRHGIAPRAAAGRVVVTASRERGALTLSVRDDGVGLPEAFCVERCGGVGLRNVRARLGQLFPADHRFEVAAAHGGGAAVSLQIPLAFEEPMYVGA
ncbi:histidine kinase [Nannocystis sp. ILAH1]|uniref:sensor histidine kinase n=1 Tax=unclassified Nannocystis TaxID=2627009 RepID=UPI00226D6C75|nr:MULTISPECIES: histidine kinase [unclassified Nannocystis]MCY0992750.1 histidine kinase [Nannocystis sp. ILAH1]MCY1070021.1 histidine kinase [Nannocystis sp. RBIL2]